MNTRTVQSQMDSDRAMSPYRLAPHVCHCVTDDGHVLLDLRRSRYYGLSRGQDPHLEGLTQLAPLELPAEKSQLPPWASLLIEAGLLQPAGLATNETNPATGDIDPADSGLNGPPSPPSAFHTLAFAYAHAWARTALRRISMYEIAVRVKASRRISTLGAIDQPLIEELVAHFRYLRPWAFASRGQCLLHALTLVRFLTLFDVHATWIVGVTTRPWAAHSWVQHGASVLDGIPEHVLPYHPIMIV